MVIVIKVLVQLVAFGLAGLPAFIWFVAYRVYDPRGFWEGFWFWVLTSWLLGIFQLGGVMLAIGSFIELWFKKKVVAHEVVE